LQENMMEHEAQRELSGEAIAASQQTGDELPASLRNGTLTDGDQDDPAPSGAIDPDDPSPVNTARGFSVGGAGVGIEPGTDASFGEQYDDTQLAADANDQPRADNDFDPDADGLGMGTDPA